MVSGQSVQRSDGFREFDLWSETRRKRPRLLAYAVVVVARSLSNFATTFWLERCRSAETLYRKMLLLSIEKIGFDTAESELSKAIFLCLRIPRFRNTTIICKDPYLQAKEALPAELAEMASSALA